MANVYIATGTLYLNGTTYEYGEVVAEGDVPADRLRTLIRRGLIDISSDGGTPAGVAVAGTVFVAAAASSVSHDIYLFEGDLVLILGANARGQTGGTMSLAASAGLTLNTVEVAPAVGFGNCGIWWTAVPADGTYEFTQSLNGTPVRSQGMDLLVLRNADLTSPIVDFHTSRETLSAVPPMDTEAGGAAFALAMALNTTAFTTDAQGWNPYSANQESLSYFLVAGQTGTPDGQTSSMTTSPSANRLFAAASIREA